MRQAFARQVQDLTNAIANGTPMAVSAEDGLRAVEMVEAATRSAETDQAVRLPLA
jgi:myo-inositol 2-dehydrogenase/D-chiro-inositol 1-dehydrogenase